MKKWFDKHVAQSSKGQVVVLSLAFVLLVVIGGLIGRSIASDENDDNMTAFGRPETWGFMQCVDGGFVQATIANNTKSDDDGIIEVAPLSVIILSLGFWFAGMVLVSFLTGVVTDFLGSRREEILNGHINYSFTKNYKLIVGYDFQVKNLVREILNENIKDDVVVITDTDVAPIYEDILSEISSKQASRLFVIRNDIAMSESYSNLLISGATSIYVIGDGNALGRDGKVVRAVEIISEKTQKEVFESTRKIDIYIHIEDLSLYSHIKSTQLSIDNLGIFDVRVYNYYESWTWLCWSKKDSFDYSSKGHEDNYLPIRHRKGSTKSELFIIGASSMGRAMVNYAMPLMNYGGTEKNNKITIFDQNQDQKGFLPEKEVLDSMPEVEVVYSLYDGNSTEANEIMIEAAKKEDTSVTVVVALSDPASALRVFSELSNKLRRYEISILIWQATHSKNCIEKKYLNMGGTDTIADKTMVRCFGMTNILPWKDNSRLDYGMAINYFYNSWFPYDSPFPVSPKATDSKLVEEAKQMWNTQESIDGKSNGTSAKKMWDNTPRWKKWSSINSGDTFREKSLLFKGASYEKAAELALRAEHNRWWVEKLMSGWQLDTSAVVHDGSHADKKQMLHGDLVPFEMLSEVVMDKDKINIAAMSVFGFLD